jgi:hypothetical protein
MTMYFYDAITIYVVKSIDRIIIERFIIYLVEIINFLLFRAELKIMLYSLLKCQWLENINRIGSTVQKIRAKDKLEHLYQIHNHL